MKNLCFGLLLVSSLPSFADVYFSGDDKNFISFELDNAHHETVVSTCTVTKLPKASCQRLARINLNEFDEMRKCVIKKVGLNSGLSLALNIIFPFPLSNPTLAPIGLVLGPKNPDVRSKLYNDAEKSFKKYIVYSTDSQNDKDFISKYVDHKSFVDLFNETLIQEGVNCYVNKPDTTFTTKSFLKKLDVLEINKIQSAKKY